MHTQNPKTPKPQNPKIEFENNKINLNLLFKEGGVHKHKYNRQERIDWMNRDHIEAGKTWGKWAES